LNKERAEKTFQVEIALHFLFLPESSIALYIGPIEKRFLLKIQPAGAKPDWCDSKESYRICTDRLKYYAILLPGFDPIPIQ
jgi:hypothetical protein